MPVHLYVERKEPTNSSSVLFINAAQLLFDQRNGGPKKFNLLIENVQDFHVKKDFMFATRKVPNNTHLLISYRRGSFVKADFQTDLEIKVRQQTNENIERNRVLQTVTWLMTVL